MAHGLPHRKCVHFRRTNFGGGVRHLGSLIRTRSRHDHLCIHHPGFRRTSSSSLLCLLRTFLGAADVAMYSCLHSRTARRNRLRATVRSCIIVVNSGRVLTSKTGDHFSPGRPRRPAATSNGLSSSSRRVSLAFGVRCEYSRRRVDESVEQRSAVF